GLEVEPRREGPIAGPLGIVVHDRVKDLQAVMAHAQAVGVGEGQTEFAPHLAMILDNGVQLTANVLGRHLHPRQQPKGSFLESGLNHEDYLAWQIESKRPNVIMPESGDNVSRKEKTSAGGWDHPTEANR